MRILAAICLLVGVAFSLHAQNGCMTIHGRAHLYGGDLQLRIWHIGTHHDFEPAGDSWVRVIDWLNEGTTRSERQEYNIPSTAVDLFADFVVCPTEPFKQGSVQKAKVLSATHRRYVHFR